MQLTGTVGNLAALTRFDPASLIARLQMDVERELEAMAASGQSLDTAARRDALARVLRQLGGRA
jgi:hypothetical protein